MSFPPKNEICADPVAITSNIAPHVHCASSKVYFSYRNEGSSRVICPGKPLPPCAGRASRSLAPYPPGSIIVGLLIFIFVLVLVCINVVP